VSCEPGWRHVWASRCQIVEAPDGWRVRNNKTITLADLPAAVRTRRELLQAHGECPVELEYTTFILKDIAFFAEHTEHIQRKNVPPALTSFVNDFLRPLWRSSLEPLCSFDSLVFGSTRKEIFKLCELADQQFVPNVYTSLSGQVAVHAVDLWGAEQCVDTIVAPNYEVLVEFRTRYAAVIDFLYEEDETQLDEFKSLTCFEAKYSNFMIRTCFGSDWAKQPRLVLEAHLTTNQIDFAEGAACPVYLHLHAQHDNGVTRRTHVLAADIQGRIRDALVGREAPVVRVAWNEDALKMPINVIDDALIESAVKHLLHTPPPIHSRAVSKFQCLSWTMPYAYEQ